MDDFDQQQNEFDDRDMPDESDMDQDDYTITIRCLYCRQFIDEESELCPRCGMLLSSEEKLTGQSGWVKILILLTIVSIVLFWIL